MDQWYEDLSPSKTLLVWIVCFLFAFYVLRVIILLAKGATLLDALFDAIDGGVFKDKS